MTGEASIDDDVCAQLTAPNNSKSGRTSSVSRIVSPFYLFSWNPQGREAEVKAQLLR